ncbi:MAG: hypothetical protein IT566_11785 [Rhodospirillaceae bacterium]|nr:hypothetical protein [Rhodospirillaceae bacterium]
MKAVLIALVAVGAGATFVTPVAAAETAAAKPAVAGEGAGQQIFDSQAPETLMFSIDELAEIRNRMVTGSSANAERNGGRGHDPIEDATLYLSTILYYGPDEWTIWINGVPIGPKQELNSFEVTQISTNYVDLLVPLSAQGMRPVRLSPNQTFVTKSGAVVEGPWK